MPAINTPVWLFLVVMPWTFPIEAFRASQDQLHESTMMCCCRKLLAKETGCEEGTKYVPASNQCCKLMESCKKGLWAKWGSHVAGGYYRTNKPQKCVAGSKVKGGVYSDQTLLQPDKMFAKIKIQKSGQKTWEDLSASNWYKVGAFRIKAYFLNWVLKDGESVSFFVDVFRHGKKVNELSRNYSTDKNQQVSQFKPAAVHFTEAHLRKEYWLTLRYWKVSNKRTSPAIVKHMLLYAAPTEVCGVNFLQHAHRICNGPRNEPKLALSKEIPGYALGVEYELVGAPGDTKGISFNEYYDDSLSGGDERSDLSHSLAQLDANMSYAMRVGGHPCTGPCEQLKTCLWKKLDWNDNQRGVWKIERDMTVSAMGDGQTTDELQHAGVPFELVSPGPPNILVGQKGMMNAMKVLSAIHDMGAQAPLSAGLHLHVNTRSKTAGSDITLSLKEVMAVFFSWARFQLIIDEIISPDRVGNPFAKGLYLAWGLGSGRASALKSIFTRTHKRVWRMTREEDDSLSSKDGCLAVIGNKWLSWCEGDYVMNTQLHKLDNPEKYFQINLTPLGRFGTIEFRAGTATLDVNRAARWFQFLVGFVHTFKNTELSEMFFNGELEDDWKELTLAQSRATPEELKMFMANHVEDDFLEYFTQDRPFEKEPDTGCVKVKL